MSLANEVSPDAHGNLWDNPMGTNGFEFVEYASPNPAALHDLFKRMGFTPVAKHKSKAITLYRQGDINFLVNEETAGHAADFAKAHGPCACAMGFRVGDAQDVHKRLLALDAEDGAAHDNLALSAPAIEGIGGSLIYLIDDNPYTDYEFFAGVDTHPAGVGLEVLDHLTHNVAIGGMDRWAGFYEKLFNFKEIRYFDIEGQHTGLKSRAMTGPCGKLRIPINESSDDKSQIAEYLDEYKGEGIQHIALTTENIYQTVDKLREAGVSFMTPPPETYYEMIPERLPNHAEDLSELKSRAILMDGSNDGRILLQIFTETAIGPIFFEIIQRKGDQGFGEGNFKALFESMERDQIRRGVLKVDE